MIPTLATARLTLRAPAERDLPAMLAFGASPRSRFVGGTADRWTVWTRLLAGLGHWALRGFGWFTLDLAATGQIVGRCGPAFHDGYPEAELGWHLYDGFEGQGYATEAATAARDWYCRTISPSPLISMIDPANAASARVAERLGAKWEREAEVFGHPVGIWRHPATP